jgi:hypothetical protein
VVRKRNCACRHFHVGHGEEKALVGGGSEGKTALYRPAEIRW